MTTITFKMHPPCHIYSCAKCPYLEYPFCTYSGRMKEQGKEVIGGVEIHHEKMTYHQWIHDWQKDMMKHYTDKRRVSKRRF